MSTRLILTATLVLAFAVMPSASALPGDLSPVENLAVVTKAKGNVLSWSYPADVKARDVASIEIWRFDGLSTGTFVAQAHGKHTTYTDTASTNPDALYTMRYVTKDGDQSSFSDARSAHYPYCDVFVVGLRAPYIVGPYDDCLVPLPVPIVGPILDPTAQPTIYSVQKIIASIVNSNE